jgi:alpha-mannosidase
MTSRDEIRQHLALLQAGRRHLAERFLAEAEFAEGLAKLHPGKAKRWARLLADASAVVAKVLAARRLDRLEAAVREAEAVLAPIGKVAKKYAIHCVGHAHIDMNWMWSWPETVATTNDTFLTVLKLMDEFPDFCFTQSQASVYALVRDYNPALLGRIRRRVAEGRWEVAAVHWVEGDKNIAGGEALARHLLYTRRFMMELLGLAPEDVVIDWEPDTFGHAHTIPTIDSRAGVRRYYMCRGGDFAKPPVFWWEGPDGSRLLVNLETTWYNDSIGPHNTRAMLAFCEKTGIADWMNVYGVGDHGGGPTRRDILRAHDMDSWPIFPNFRLATTRDYYAILEANGEKWPVLDRELNYEFTGCYTSQATIKHATRYGENYCLEAEAAAALASRAVGRPYPRQSLRESWINTLFGHFHDILPGSGVRATREYQVGLFQKTMAATGMIKTESLRAIAAAVDTSFAGTPGFPVQTPGAECMALGGGPGRGTVLGGITTAGHVTDGPRAFLVLNPTAWPRQEIVTVTVWDAEAPGAPEKSFVVRTPDGRTMAAQRLAAGEYWGHRFVDLAFPAAVGALGYAAYIVEEGQAPAPADAVKFGGEHRWEHSGVQDDFTLENELLFAAFGRQTGGLVKFIEKATGLNLVCPCDPAAILEYFLERPHGGTAWVIGDIQARESPLPLDALALDLKGPYVATLAAKLKIKDSTATVTYAMKAGQPWLDVTVQVRWLERGGPEIGVPMLRMRYPLEIDAAKGRYEIPFGWIDRDLTAGEEVPALRWADVTGRVPGRQAAAGCALLNDSKYGHSLEESTLRLTLIRSTYDPDPLPEIGDHCIRMGLLPHGKAPPAADLVRLGAAFNHPLLVAATDVHAGTLPARGAAVSAGPANVVVSSVRQAQDDGGIIFHLYETAGKAAKAKVALDAALMGRPAEAIQVDLLERPVAKPSAKVAKDGFTVSVPARGIAAVKVTFTK